MITHRISHIVASEYHEINVMFAQIGTISKDMARGYTHHHACMQEHLSNSPNKTGSRLWKCDLMQIS